MVSYNACACYVVVLCINALSQAVLQAADTAKLSGSSCSTQVVGDTAAWTHAVKTCLCIQVLCNALKWCLLYLGGSPAALPNWLQIMFTTWQPHSMHALAVYATGAATAAWLVAGFCSGKSYKCTMQHRLYTRTLAQGIAAAQASAIICTNWATAFYTLVLLVPLLSWPLCSSKRLNRTHVCLTLMLVVLVFFSCLQITSHERYAPLMQNFSGQAGWTQSKDFADNAMLASTLSWRTNSLSALLTILLPACMVILQ